MKTALKLLVMAFIAAAASRMIFVVRLDPSGTAVILPRNIPLPDAPLTPWDAKGKTASAASLPARPALLVFFGTWCPPCLAEYETLLKISKRPDSPPLIGIAVRDDPEKIEARGTSPLIEVTEDFEKNGFFKNVVFTCGMIAEGEKIRIYYGTCDTNIAAAELSLAEIYENVR